MRPRPVAATLAWLSEEAMAVELRRRGYTVTPPEVIDLPGNGRLIAPVSLLNIPEVPDPIFDAMLREALGLPAEEPAEATVVDGVELFNVHSPERCAGYPCVVHAPSDHHMRAWPLHWRRDRGLMERTCPHGIGHPDPDDLAYHVRSGREDMGVHGCDLCCREEPSDG